jgi:hypothetical protein
MFRKLLYILAAASLLVGCEVSLREDVAQVGWLAVDFSCNDDVKAGETDLSAYSVSITGSSLEYTLRTTCGELPDLLELKPGEYAISVSSPGEASAAFDEPIYSSSKDFTISAGQTRSVSLLLSNVQVSFQTSDSFNADTVASCLIAVSNGEDELTWSLDDVLDGRTGYFTGASKLYIHLEGTARNGVALRYDDVIYDVRQSEHYRITLGEYVPVI